MNIGTSLKTISKNQLCSFVGTGGYVELAETDVLSDGSVVTSAAMLPLLNSGNDKGEGILPPGYQKVEFLESSGTQYIDTGIHPPCTATISFSWLSGGSSWCWWGVNAAYYNNRGATWGVDKYSDGYYGHAYAVHRLGNAPLVSGQKNDMIHGIYATRFSFTLNGVAVSHGAYGSLDPTNSYCFFDRASIRERLYTATIADTDGKTAIDLIPVLNVDGTPCLYDKVSRKCLYNAGTGHFRVGIATLQQAREFQLPDNTGNAVRVLHVSLPYEARTDFITQNHLDYLASLNWSINVQYRDGDIPSDYTKVDFLESSGTQYLRLPDLNVTNDDSVKLDFSVSKYSGKSADGVFSAYKFDSGEKMRVYTSDRTIGLAVGLVWGGGGTGTAKISYNEKLSVLLSRSTIELNGAQIGIPQEDTFSYTDFVLFTQMVLNQYWHALIKLFSFAVPGKCRLIPALRNADGVPGMWDTVSKQFFENSGTGAFIVGIKTLNDVRLLDKTLPAVPAGSTYSIALSLPVEASTDALAQKALKDLAARRWSINIRYREDEIPAGYAKVSFLESSGAQYLNSGIRGTQDLRFATDVQMTRTQTSIPFGSEDSDGGIGYALHLNEIYLTQFRYGTRSYWKTSLPCNNTTRGLIIFEGNTLSDEASGYSVTVNQAPEFTTLYDIGIFSLERANSVTRYPIRIYSLRFWSNSTGEAIRDFIPVINTDGIPGMWDRANKQFYENAGTGQFRVGLASKEAVRNLYLEPDVPSGTTINLSVPAGTTNEDTDILKANNPNYTFNIQYRS